MSTENMEGTQATKIPMLNPDEFELWQTRIRQYMLLTDYMMWEVVMNGPNYPKGPDGERIERPPPKTDAERKERATEWKSLSTLLLSIPNEYQKKFQHCEDAKVLMEAIIKRFGGNANTKKNKRSLLKQQFENFAAVKSETLTQTFDRFQKLVGDLENHDVTIDKDDLNSKFLRSLGKDWNLYTVGLRQSADLDKKEVEDLYNDLRNFEPEVLALRQSTDGSTSNNAAFMSVGDAGSSSTSSANDHILESFFASHVNSALTTDDLEQLNDNDLEEMDLRW